MQNATLYSVSTFRFALCRIFVAALLINVANATSLLATPYGRIHSFSMDDGLPHSDVNAITQDRDGYMWFATFGGLSKWDGYRIKTFRMDNSLLSSDRILSLLAASDSTLYIGTESGGLNRYNPETEKIEPVADDSNCSTAVDRVINDLFQDTNGTVWVCHNEGLARIVERQGKPVVVTQPQWRRYSVQCGATLDSCRLLLSTNEGPVIYNTRTDALEPVCRAQIQSNCISVCPLSGGRMALVGGWGVYVYNASKQDVQQLCFFSARTVTEDSRGNLWVGSFERGLFQYDCNFKLLAHYHPELPSPHAISSFEISSLFEDRSGVLWIGTIGGGLNRLSVVEKRISCFTKTQQLSQNRVITFLESADGTLWISTHGGVDLFNRRTEKFTSLWINGQPSAQFGVVSAFYTDSNGDIWLGTWNKGLWIIDGRSIREAIITGKVRARQVYHRSIDGAMSVFRIIRDRDGDLWVSTNRGVFEYVRTTGEWINFAHDNNDNNSLPSDFATDLLADASTQRKTIWVGSRLGLSRIVFDQYNQPHCQRLNLARSLVSGDESRGTFVSSIHCDRNNDLWIASIGGGLQRMVEGRFDDAPPRFERFDTSNTDLFNNELESLQEDNHGAFWIGGYGISRFDPKTHSVRHYTVKDRLQSNSFKIWASYKLRDGQLVFGGVNGFNIFHPDSITDNEKQPHAAISRLKVWNRVISAGDTILGKVVLPRAANRLSRLELSHRCNNLTFEFSSFAYVAPEYNRYRYRLENFDADWNYTDGKSPQAVYSNLRPGNYRFELYGSNEDGIWSASPACVQIVIHPPFYATRLAVVCYVLLAILIIYGWHRHSLRKMEERHRIELERNKYYEEQKSSASMLQFYTDIAHELKTPLSLIAAPVEELLMNPHIGATTRDRLSLVNRNTSALTSLLEQILDLRKYENQKIKLRATKIEIGHLLIEIAELFKPLATNLGIRFEIEIAPNSSFEAWIDRRKIETVIINLLYNAFKYTPRGRGKVILTCEQDAKSVVIGVRDNGIGIAEDEQTRIFERFYQARNHATVQKSTGIGLALSKHIVELHHGQISVESELYSGSVFRVCLLKGTEHFDPEQIGEADDALSEEPILPKNIEDDFYTPQQDDEPTQDKQKSVVVLIAEDNASLRSYLRSALQTRYNILVADNGSTAYEMAVAEQPDLILSDIVMPGLTGLELCKSIKENAATSHINIILLTAHDLLANEVSGYRVGADGYIAKPFSLEVLFSRIDNLIARQDKMREQLHAHAEVGLPDIPVMTADEKFFRHCMEVIEAYMSDPQFDIQDLSRRIGVSRSQLNRRINAVTGLSPLQLIRSIRLKRAIQLLSKDRSLSISEVMYRVGYTNLSHFSKIFYREFGFLPKEFALHGGEYADKSGVERAGLSSLAKSDDCEIDDSACHSSTHSSSEGLG